MLLRMLPDDYRDSAGNTIHISKIETTNCTVKCVGCGGDIGNNIYWIYIQFPLCSECYKDHYYAS